LLAIVEEEELIKFWKVRVKVIATAARQ